MKLEMDRYKILRELSGRAAGRRYLARDSRASKEVEVQLVRTFDELPEPARAAAIERFLGQAGRIAALKHPNILELLDSGVHRGVPFLVTEHVDGTPLSAYCARGSLLPPVTVAELVADLAEGLDHAHRSGVVHGDIQPANLLWVEAATVKIAGFGLRPEPEPDGKGELHGTLGYQAPEQIRGEPLDGKADLFALGAVLYELLSGAKAFPGDSQSTVLYRIVNEPVRDLLTLDPPIHEGLAGVTLRALAKRPEQRFANAAQFREALHAAGVACRVDESIGTTSGAAAPDAAASAEPPAAEGAPTTSRPRRSATRPFVLGTLLLILLAAAAVAWLRERAPTPPAAPAWLETRVRSEPPGLEILIDGQPLDPTAGGVVRFQAEPPFGVVSASAGCRSAERRLQPTDAGGELVLVLDPAEVNVEVNPTVQGATVLLNGKAAGTTPAQLSLDLCQANRLELQAEGFRPATVDIPAGAEPLEARKLLYAVELEPIPRGILTLPRRKDLQLVYYVDGKRMGKSVTEVELEEGRHELRLKNEYHWIDVRRQIEIEGGGTTRPPVDVSLGTLAVQAFPANCKVFVRRPGGSWRYLDETPAERRIATGDYEIKVQLNPTGEIRTARIKLGQGDNPPVRVAFGGGG